MPAPLASVRNHQTPLKSGGNRAKGQSRKLARAASVLPQRLLLPGVLLLLKQGHCARCLLHSEGVKGVWQYQKGTPIAVVWLGGE